MLGEWTCIHYVGATCQNLEINVYISFYILQVCKNIYKYVVFRSKLVPNHET